MIAKGKIQKNTKFIDARNKVWKFDGAEFIKEIGDSDIYSDLEFATMDFKIIEDEEEIDIQSIEEFGIDDNEYIKTKIGSFKTRKMDIAFLHKINELVQAVKQLDKKMNSIEQK